MRIVILSFEPSIARLLQVVLELEGYRFTVTRDPAEALRMIEESAEPCIVLTDNLKVNPAGSEALSTLRASPALRARVRVIGLDVESVRQMELGWDILDYFVSMPFTAMTLLDSIEANASKLSGQ